MTYRFVDSATDLGRRVGPIRAVNLHMAEGGGTVEFLSRPNPDGVSVHYVVRYTGEVVQMLLESHMQSAIRIHQPDGSYAIRQTDDADGFYGHTAAVATLGDWADTHKTLGPNHATIGVEIEGFAVSGPNKNQQASLVRLVTDIRTRYPQIGLTGHRDHNVKPCPGRLIPWTALGGHGPATGDDMPYELKFERWKWNGTEITTVGAPIVNGAVDYGSRLAILSDTGGANRRLESVGRTSLTPVSGALDDPFYDALTGYAIPVPCTPQALADAKAAGRESFRADVEAIP